MDIAAPASASCSPKPWVKMYLPQRARTEPTTPSVGTKRESMSSELSDAVAQSFAVPPPTAARRIIETSYNYELGSASHLWEDEDGNLYLSTTMCVCLADLSP